MWQLYWVLRQFNVINTSNMKQLSWYVIQVSPSSYQYIGTCFLGFFFKDAGSKYLESSLLWSHWKCGMMALYFDQNYFYCISTNFGCFTMPWHVKACDDIPLWNIACYVITCLDISLHHITAKIDWNTVNNFDQNIIP